MIYVYLCTGGTWRGAISHLTCIPSTKLADARHSHHAGFRPRHRSRPYRPSCEGVRLLPLDFPRVERVPECTWASRSRLVNQAPVTAYVSTSESRKAAPSKLNSHGIGSS